MERRHQNAGQIYKQNHQTAWVLTSEPKMQGSVNLNYQMAAKQAGVPTSSFKRL